MDDGELVLRARTGDRRAFGELVTRYRGRLYRLCYGMVGNRADAEDLAHDAFVEAYLKLEQLRDLEKFGSWIRTLALNLCRMWHRRRKRDQEGMSAARSVLEESGQAIPAEIADGLSRLSAPHRMVLLLHYWEGLSYEETAAFLDVPVGTVMSRLYRARNALRKVVEEMAEHEDMPETSDESFSGDVDAEIDLLLEMESKDGESMARLSVILRSSPERFVRLVREAEDERTVENLVAVVRWMGRPIMEVLAGCCFSADAALRAGAAAVLRRWAARCGPGPKRNAHVFLDLLTTSSVDAETKTALLLDLLEVVQNEDIQTLFINVLLCYPDAAFPMLLERFWTTPEPKDLYSSYVLFALARMGTRFCEALLETLPEDDTHREILALIGIEAVARAIDPPGLAGASPERWPLEIRFRGRIAPIPRTHLDEGVLSATIERCAGLMDHPAPEVRDRALRILGLLHASAFMERIKACLAHGISSTRLAAIRALADIGDADAAASLIEVALAEMPAERRAAVEALGRLGVPEAEPLFLDLIGDMDARVRQAAVIALGEIGDEEAQKALGDLTRSSDKKLARAAASALYGGRKGRGASSETTQKRLQKVRGDDANPVFYASSIAAIWALPEIRPYGERDLTHRIAQVCDDYSTTRRYLVMEKRNSLMTRGKGVYELTELGKAVWRIEHFIERNYLAAEE